MALKRIHTLSSVLIPFRPFFFVLIFFTAPQIFAQNINTNDTAQYLTLQQCIDYAMQHQPALNQSIINVSIAKTTNAINLAGWYPQVGISGNLTHYIQLPTSYVTNTSNPGGPLVKVKTGVVNTVIPELSATQALFSPALLYAAKSAPLYVMQAVEVTDSTKIDLVANVSKAFYSLLLTFAQINTLKEDTVRLAQSLTNAYHQYVGGIVDETDYQQANITLNNSRALLRQANENVVPQYAALKQLMGFPPEKQFSVSFDTLALMRDIAFDTTQQLHYEKRIETKQLQTAKDLQHQLIRYYQRAFLPTVGAFFNYNLEFESNIYSNLYQNVYPNSLFGFSLSVPIFTGFSRLKNIKKAKEQEQLLDWSGINLKSQIYSDYTTALANYKGNLYNLQVMQENVAMAKRVYFVVELQYKEGIVAYLNLITAESNLITAEISYITALYTVLSNKIDLQKAMGIISY